MNPPPRWRSEDAAAQTRGAHAGVRIRPDRAEFSFESLGWCGGKGAEERQHAGLFGDQHCVFNFRNHEVPCFRNVLILCVQKHAQTH